MHRGMPVEQTCPTRVVSFSHLMYLVYVGHQVVDYPAVIEDVWEGTVVRGEWIGEPGPVESVFVLLLVEMDCMRHDRSLGDLGLWEVQVDQHFVSYPSLLDWMVEMHQQTNDVQIL